MKEIEKIIEKYDNTDWSVESLALGTVVKVEESSYRRIGARMLVSSSGNWIGGISGGCLEGDALKRAKMAISKDQSSIIVYDTLEDDAHQIGVGLGCNGRIEVLFTPIKKDDPNNQLEQLKQFTSSRQPNLLFQVINVMGADKSMLGAFFTENEVDQLSASIGIPATEIKEKAALVRERGKSKEFWIKTESGQPFEILIEWLRPKTKIILCGDNYDVNAFVSIAHELGWEIHVAGKKRKLNKHVFDHATSVVEPEEAPKIGYDDHTAVVLMSHDYKTDLRLLRYYLKQDVPYIGLLGPKKRTMKMQNELLDIGESVILENEVNVFGPVGLDIGAESPEEIALSISAEIIATMRGRDGQPLRKRIGPIHERAY
ncbi:MAG: XdhC family protein [Bacteroidota bacterium]